MLAVKLEDIERGKFDGLLAKHQIRQYFPLTINCAIRYIHDRALQYQYTCSYLHVLVSIGHLYRAMIL